MKFILDHDIQRKTKPGLPLEIKVDPERRTGEYPVGCPCQWVFRIHADSMHVLKEMGMVLDENKSTCVCLCMGRLHAEAVGELLASHNGHKPSGTLFVPSLTRPICFIDIESTGVEPVTDRILEFAAVVLLPDGSRRRFCQRFNPEMPIPKEATEIHGIRDEDVAGCPPFREWAARLSVALSGKDIGGYNLRRLDLPILDEEFRRCGSKLDLTGVSIIDASGIFFKREPRKLENAVEKYLGRSHADAHGAAPDAEASLDVWLAQLNQYEDVSAMTLEQQAEYCLMGDNMPCDLAGKLYRDPQGDVRYNFGKNRDKRVVDDEGYAGWMLDCKNPGFPGSTCDVLRKELKRIGCILAQ